MTESLRSLLDSPREIADEILDLTTCWVFSWPATMQIPACRESTGSTVFSSSVPRP